MVSIMISLIYARSLDHFIGRNGRVPWHLPDEFAHFENTTMGKPIVMGRKTYEDHESMLHGRTNIVISTQTNYKVATGVKLVCSYEEAVALAQRESERVFVIGGSALIAAALPTADTVFETVVATLCGGDTVLPEFDFGSWDTRLLQEHPADKHHEFSFRIYQHKRQQPGDVLP